MASRCSGLRYSGIHEVFVYVFEVGEEDLSPEDEFVQGFGLGIQGFIALVKEKKKPQAVSSPGAGEPVEEIIDGVERRNQERYPGSAFTKRIPQVLFEKDQGTPVGEDETPFPYVRSGQIVGRHLLQERIHKFDAKLAIIPEIPYICKRWNNSKLKHIKQH